MNSIVKKLKLYRIATILNIIPSYYKEAKAFSDKCGCSTLMVFFDMFICLFRYGASSENYVQFRFYGKDKLYRDSFVTWRRSIEIMKYTPKEIIDTFLDKAKFNSSFCDFIKREWLDCRNASIEEISSFIDKHGEIIVKPIDLACGKGVYKISSKDTVSQLVGGGYIIEECISNIKEISAISPRSLNTIRVTTLVDKGGKANIISVNLRVGNGNSITDNFCTGGICCSIDVDNSCINGDAGNLKDERFMVHPSTGVVFNGYKIPNLQEVVDLSKRLAMIYPQARLVGWDVVLREGEIDVLEGNIPPAEEVFQFDLVGKYHYIKNLL